MTAATQQSGADVLLRALRDQGVEVIFGYPGGAVLPIYDAIFQQNSIRHILVRHEQAAVHAAEGYARSTGKVGVVLEANQPLPKSDSVFEVFFQRGLKRVVPQRFGAERGRRGGLGVAPEWLKFHRVEFGLPRGQQHGQQQQRQQYPLGPPKRGNGRRRTNSHGARSGSR